MTTEDAKSYLASREIPQLFESLMTGLMYYRPEDHIDYLQECLKKIRENGVEEVRWNLFIESRRKTPLPAIQSGTGGNGRTDNYGREPSFITDSKNVLDNVMENSLNQTSSMENAIVSSVVNNRPEKRTGSRPQTPLSPIKSRRMSAGQEPKSLEEKRGTPLPPIGYTQDNTGFPDRIKLPNCPIVLIMGGPGSGRATHSKRLVERYTGWVHVSMGDILRQEIFKKGTADDKWGAVGTLVSEGEMAPEELTIDLVKSTLQSCTNARGIIIEGYPRNMGQIEEYERFIGRADLVFVLDCEEHFLQQRLLLRGKETGRADDNAKAIASRISSFKENTLPAIKYWDDKGKLVIIEGDRDADEIFYDLAVLFDNTFYTGGAPVGGTGGAPVSPRPPSGRKPASPRPRPGSGRYSRQSDRGASRPGSGFVNVPKKVDVKVTDTGRKPDMPTCPIMFVMGGPGSGRGTQCKRLIERYPDFVHLSMGDILRGEIFKKGDGDEKWGMINKLVTDGNMAPEDMTVELVKENIKKNKGAKGIILEGYPRTQKQMEEFNEFIGGLDIAVLLDCDEYFMQKRITDRKAETGRVDDNIRAIANRISFYKHNTLPVLAHIDDLSKLVVINGDRDSDEIFYELSQLVDQSFFGGSVPAPAPGAVPSGAPAPGSPSKQSGRIPFPTLEVSVPDTGRKSGMVQGPIIAIIGSPGSGADKIASKLTEKYSFVLITVKDSNKVSTLVQSNSSAKGVFLEGFPKNKAQLEEFNSTVGGMDLAIVIDCDDAFARSNAGSEANQIDAYKQNTLPVLGHYEDFGKLQYVNVQSQTADEVDADVCKAVDKVLKKPAKSAAPASSGGSSGYGPTVSDFKAVVASVPRLKVDNSDNGRVSGLPACPMVALFGAAGSNVESVAKKFAEKNEGIYVQGQGKSAADIASALPAEAKLIVLENFPSSPAQLEEFNTKIGGMALAIVLDTSEETSKKAGADDAKISNYKSETLPVLGHYDDCRKLDVVVAEKSEEEVLQAVSDFYESLLRSKES